MTTCADLECGGSQSLTGLARLKVRQDLADSKHTHTTPTLQRHLLTGPQAVYNHEAA